MPSSSLQRTARRITVRSLRLLKEEDGVVMTEFMIIGPLLIFLITGTIQFMGISHADALLQYANFMACRAGIVHYEPIMQDWDESRSGGNRNEKLIEVMDRTAEHAFGPIFQGIVGYEDLAEDGRPISHAPSAVMEVRVSPGTIQLPAAQYPYLPVWLTSETEVDLGLPWPWVGRVIQAMHVGAPAVENEQQAAARGLDPFSNLSEPPEMATMYYDDLPYIVIKSDAYLDLRESDDDAREFLFPFNVSGGVYQRIDHDTHNQETVTLEDWQPQPLALPLQTRLR